MVYAGFHGPREGRREGGQQGRIAEEMKKRTTIYLDEELHKKVRMLAIKENTTMARIFVLALKRYLSEIQEDPRQEKFAEILGK